MAYTTAYHLQDGQGLDGSLGGCTIPGSITLDGATASHHAALFGARPSPIVGQGKRCLSLRPSGPLAPRFAAQSSRRRSHGQTHRDQKGAERGLTSRPGLLESGLGKVALDGKNAAE